MKKKIIFQKKEFFGGGIILYHGKKLLLQKVDNRDFWEDFGGRTDRKDKSILETSFREAKEESNGILNEEFLKEQIQKNKSKCYYILNDNKYFIHMIYVTRKTKEELNSSLFGSKECHDGINRKVEWVSKNGELKLHPRIKL